MRTRFHILLACLAFALPLAVTAGAHAAGATPGLLVVNDANSTLTSYPLPANGDAKPTATVSANTSNSLGEPIDVALDGAGNAWVANDGSHTVVEYSQAQLAAGGDPTPLVTLTADSQHSLSDPAGVAFDPSGDLWVANQDAGTLLEYTPSQLAAGGAQVPAVTISPNGADSIDTPYALTFDPAGNLWVASNGNNTLVEFSAAQLSASGAPTPTAIISPDGSAELSRPTSVSFDPAGDLWVACAGSGMILEYTPGELQTGTPTPAKTLSADSAGSLKSPFQAAFDAAGDLWVAGYGSDTIVEFDAAQLAAGGSQAPVATIEGADTGLAGPQGLAVEEAPTVSSISLERGPSGTGLTISGAGFYPGSMVDFGGVRARSVSYVSPYELTAVAPAGSGTVDVTVTTGLGTSGASAADRFSYATTPDVTPTALVGNDATGTLSSFPLSASGDVTPAATLSDRSGGLSNPIDGALDAAGDEWVPSSADTVLEYTRSELAAGGAQTPAVTIRSDSTRSLQTPSGVAFDQAGDLWVTNRDSFTVVEYTKAQLAAGGAQVPAVTLSTDSAPSLDEPIGLDFDAAGNLWVANFAGNTVVEYAKDQLGSSGAPTPAVTLTADAGNSLASPDALTFDGKGDLWVTNGFLGNNVVEYTPSQLVTGAPTPAVIISSDGLGSLNGPDQAQFDAAGDLWVANFEPLGSSGSVVEFTPAQLASSGSPTPQDTIAGGSTGLANPWVLLIEQAPTVSSVSPAGGPAGGGTSVTISGTGFYPGSSVDFGGVPAASVAYVSPYELTAVAPAGSGVVDVSVSTGLGTSESSAADQFTYAAAQVTPPSPPAPAPAPMFGPAPSLVPRVGSLPHTLKVVGRLAGVPLSCSVMSCHGTVRLTQQVVVTVHHGRRKVRQVRTIVLGSAHYSVKAGGRAVVEVRMSAATLAALAGASGHRVSARLTVTVSGGKTASLSVALVATRHR